VRSLWSRLNREAPAYLVGGCLRDSLLGARPKDFDLATALRPQQVTRLAEAAGMRTVPTGLRFGTVTVLTPLPVQVTTLRADGRYSDRRHPDEVRFSERIEDDLARRDFTINAMALPYDGPLVDPCGGRADLAARLIRTVGQPAARFREDPLRMWRAVRFLSQLDDLSPAGPQWRLQPDTCAAIARHRAETCALSRERVRDELLRMLACRSLQGLRAAVESRLLYIAIPELAALEGFAQSHPQHDTDVLAHTLRVVAEVEPRPALRLAALLHDVAKPQCVLRSGGVTHFYGHDKLGAAMADEILRRLRLPGELAERVVQLVGHHMFPWYRAGARGYRRLLAAVGRDGLRDLAALHVADVRGSRRALAGWTLPADVAERIEQVLAEQEGGGARLAVDGHDVMAAFGLAPGPEVGRLLRAAQEWVWEDPSRNAREAILDHLAARRGHEAEPGG
jgi:tRNA nucleotidyltransferase (CCA-adding enzyme)